jgi:hypothetical protein
MLFQVGGKLNISLHLMVSALSFEILSGMVIIFPGSASIKGEIVEVISMFFGLKVLEEA